MKKRNEILELSFQFAQKVIAYCEQLELSKKYVVSRQLLKAGTSIGANVREAQSPESKADFTHKMMIALKEARETEYWLELCQVSQNYPNPTDLTVMIVSIRKILGKIVSTSKRS